MINKGAESLPNKDAQTYKQLAKFYDAKNYKKGLKNAEKLLEIHPDHPETLSLKALFLLSLGEEAKALDCAKLALMKSKMKSMFCWHTCGTIYKQRKDFNQASKCFQNALRLQSDNLQLMRQTASLQIQVRDHNNHVATRFAILKQKPNMIQNWVGFTLAHHLRGDFPSLFKALVSLDNLIKTTQLKPTELAHYYLYRVIVFRDAERWQGMYQELKKNKVQIKDEVLYHQLLYQSALKLQKHAQAEEALQFLLHKFPENLEYLKQYQELNKISSREAFVKAQNLFKSKIARVLELCHIQNPQEFKQNFSAFIKPYYVKNLISLYAQIQAIYESGKQKLIEQVFLQYEQSLKKEVYPDGTEIQSPSQYLWGLYLLAQHYSYHFHTLPRAYQYIQKAIAHTCTVPEFYLVKAEIQYKRHNNFNSLKTINQARKTDLADRYMNNICVKYLMRCERPDLGETVLRLFMRDQASLYELQNHWYIIEAGKSFLKQRNIQAGLRHLDFVAKHFIDFQGNEYDFHTYCLRKWTLREYTELIEFNDNIYDDKKYAEAAGWAMRYLKQYVFKIQEDEIKAAKAAEEDTKEQKESKKKKKKKKVVEVIQETPLQVFRKKIDYFGKDYCEKIKKNPLQQALNYAKSVSTIKYTNKGNSIENKLFGRAFGQAIDIFIHFKKPLLVLRLLNKLKRTQFCAFSLHFATLKSIIYFDQCLKDPKTNDITREFIKQFLDSTLQGKSIGSFNEHETNSWKEKISAKNQYLIDLKKKEAAVILKGGSRSQYIELFSNQITSITNSQAIQYQDLPIIFYLAHQLQFYGRLTEELKTLLNAKVGAHTTYFSDWRNEIPKLPESTWTMWWLSDYDIKREQEQQKQEKQKEKEKEGKQAKK